MRGGSMGFGAKVETKKERTLGELLEQVHPADLVQFGLIPEFVGRIPVLTHVDDLGEDDLVRILTEPKNALTRQYQKLFELDNVTLRFTSDALRAIAHRAIERKTGARGLRNVMESVMLDIMYQLPSMPGVKECVIDPVRFFHRIRLLLVFLYGRGAPFHQADDGMPGIFPSAAVRRRGPDLLVHPVHRHDIPREPASVAPQ